MNVPMNLALAAVLAAGALYGASGSWLVGAAVAWICALLISNILRNGFPKRTPPSEIGPAENGEPGERR